MPEMSAEMDGKNRLEEGEHSVKESRGQPQSGALKQATCKGNF